MQSKTFQKKSHKAKKCSSEKHQDSQRGSLECFRGSERRFFVLYVSSMFCSSCCC